MKLHRKKLLIGILIVIVLWFGSGLFIYLNFETQEKGIIGDMFGAINALFSGLALFGIIVSILIQQEELSLQRFELNKTRDEFKINRLTNILYHQIENTNKMVENTQFDINEPDSSDLLKLNFDNFLVKLVDIEKYYSERNSKKIINSHLSDNFQTMSILVRKVYNSFESFDKLLKISNLDEEQANQMKSLFRENLNFGWHGFSARYFSIIGERVKTSNDKWKVARERLLDEMLEKFTFLEQYGEQQ